MCNVCDTNRDKQFEAVNCYDKGDFERGDELDADTPTNWWHCGHCNAYLDRWRGEGDQACRCGAQYNSSGQRLRDDWQENPAWRYDDIDDLEGFELQQLAREHRA